MKPGIESRLREILLALYSVKSAHGRHWKVAFPVAK